MIEYKIIESSWADSLAEKVNKAIQQGWKPCGNINSTFEHTSGIDYHGQQERIRKINTLYQPMIME